MKLRFNFIWLFNAAQVQYINLINYELDFFIICGKKLVESIGSIVLFLYMNLLHLYDISFSTLLNFGSPWQTKLQMILNAVDSFNFIAMCMVVALVGITHSERSRV